MDTQEIEGIIENGSLEAVEGALKEIDDIFAAQQRWPITDHSQLIRLVDRLASRRSVLRACIEGCNLRAVAVLGAARMPTRTLPGLSLEDNSRAVALLTDASLLVENSDGFRLTTRTFREAYNICRNEMFAGLPVSMPATAFLVDRDVVATLRHNLALFGNDLTRIRVLFDFVQRDPQDDFSTRVDFSAAEVFEIERELRSEDGDGFVTLRLDKPSDRTPVRCNFTTPLAVGQAIYMVGHPYGLPKILAENAKVLDTSAERIFTTDLDAFTGNSSAPVVNSETGLVEGVLARGETSSLRSIQTSDGSFCYTFLRLNSPRGGGYRVRRIQALQGLF